MCSSAMVVAGKWGLDVLLDTHCHVHVPSDSAAATVVPPQRAAEYANRCCSQENISSPSIQDRKIDQLAFGTEGVERAPSTQPMRVARITMGIREQDWADAVIFGKDNLCSNGLLHRQSQEASRPQASSLTVSRKEVEESVHTVGDLDPFFRFGVGLHPWWVPKTSFVDTSNTRSTVIDLPLPVTALPNCTRNCTIYLDLCSLHPCCHVCVCIF